MDETNVSAVPEAVEAPAPSAPAPAPAEPRKTQFGSIAEAAAELERRESERRAQNAAAKAAKQASQAPAPAPEPEEVDDEPPSPDPQLSRHEDDSESDEVATDDETPEPDAPVKRIEFAGKSWELPEGTPPQLAAQIQELGANLVADYTRKTQESAQERQQAQAAQQQTAQLAQQLQQAQTVLAQFYQAAIGQPPSLELAQSDPQAYLVQRGLHEQRLQAFQRLTQQGQELAQQQHHMSAQQLAQVQAREEAELIRHLPELKSPQKRAEFARAAVEVGQRYGYSAEEVASVMDHRAVRMLADLAKLQARTAVEKTVKTKLANVPPKSAKPGVATQDGGKGARALDAKRQFMKSPRSLRDVARYLSQTEE